MNFIPRVDEILVAPPYKLDTNQLPFQSNIFILPAKHDVLQALIDEQLNAAMPHGPFHYSVPLSVERVFLAFYRYGRVESQPMPQAGWLGYTEAMIGFLVLRTPDPDLPDSDPRKHQLPELVTYLGVVYIGNSHYGGPIQEPYTIPIVLGREGYGLPKNPGRVFYEPTNAHLPNGPKVDVWDPPTGGGNLTPDTAIRVTPLYPSSYLGRRLPPPLPPEGPRRPVPLPPALIERLGLGKGPEGRRLVRDWVIFSSLLGVRGPLEVMGVPDVEDPNAVQVLLPVENVYAVAWTTLLWRTKLVGLKEFPDPKAASATSFATTCYAACVESPLEEAPGHLLGSPRPLYWDQKVDFPPVQRVDLLARFGIVPTTGREVHVDRDSMFYQEGSLLFADPSKVNVWDPIP